MTVVDASAYVDYLTSPRISESVAPFLLQGWDAPAIFAAEVMSGLRAMVSHRRLGVDVAETAIERLHEAGRTEHAFGPYSARAWELRQNLSIYDGWYVALAERLQTELVTTDARLARADGPRCEIRLLS